MRSRSAARGGERDEARFEVGGRFPSEMGQERSDELRHQIDVCVLEGGKVHLTEPQIGGVDRLDPGPPQRLRVELGDHCGLGEAGAAHGQREHATHRRILRGGDPGRTRRVRRPAPGALRGNRSGPWANPTRWPFPGSGRTRGAALAFDEVVGHHAEIATDAAAGGHATRTGSSTIGRRFGSGPPGTKVGRKPFFRDSKVVAVVIGMTRAGSRVSTTLPRSRLAAARSRMVGAAAPDSASAAGIAAVGRMSEWIRVG